VAAAQLRSAGDLVLGDLDRKGLISALSDVDILWVRLRHRIDSEVLSGALRLKMIVTATTGLNHIDLKETAHRGISVMSLYGENEFLRDVRATAEHTIGLMLSLLRHVPQSNAHVREGQWNRDLFRGWELYGKTVGIVGYGRLGEIVTRYLQAFEARILITDPAVRPERLGSNITCVSLDRLLEEADIVSLHVNLCRETRGFFGRSQFLAMKQGAWFINTARGELVDETALLDMLRSGRLAGAALDVLSDECSSGMANRAIVAYARDHNNLIITPHIGGCTTESMDKTERFLAAKCLSQLNSNAMI
jgi:D-3-phosphoglycerate dehydrogenase / 2-oxoglutarate reductase